MTLILKRYNDTLVDRDSIYVCHGIATATNFAFHSRVKVKKLQLANAFYDAP
jgi:hypothetical protein